MFCDKKTITKTLNHIVFVFNRCIKISLKTSSNSWRNFFLNDFKSIIQFSCRNQFIVIIQFNFIFEINQLISLVLKFEIINSQRFINNNKNIENAFATNISNVFVVQIVNFNYIQNEFVNRKKRKRERDDKNDAATSSINRKCYNCDSFDYLSNACINFYVSNHVFFNWKFKTNNQSKNV